MGSEMCIRDRIEALQSWLQTQSFMMTDDFPSIMENMLLELIGNSNHAYEGGHDESGGDWCVSGYMARREDNDSQKDSYICYITGITLGRTISETLVQTKNPVAKSLIDQYVLHADGDKLTDESLLTASATHDAVSCSKAGGNGLTDFLHHFTRATAANHMDQRSYVISGQGHVHFFGPYKSTVESAQRKVRQTFNVLNSVNDPPDTDHVFAVNHTFPGTIVGVRFYLDEDDLIAKYGP